MAAYGRRHAGTLVASVRRWGIQDIRRAGEAHLRGVETVPGAARRRISIHSQHRENGGTLAYRHEDPQGADSGASVSRAWLEINPRDAQRLGLRSHDSVDVISRRGRARGVELRLTEITAPGQVFMPFHFFETNVNEVTQSAFDPISREPNYKQCAVRVERSGAHL